MSILSALPKPLKLVLKPGTYQSGDTRGGLNLNNWMKNFLKRIGFADTVDCCVYYPTYPLITVADASAPTADEASNVPSGSFFMTTDGVHYNIFIVGVDGVPVFVFGTNL